MGDKSQQDRNNWRLAVNLANNWREMMGIAKVNYPYPGSPDKGLNSYAT